jgi:hypothetical protein
MKKWIGIGISAVLAVIVWVWFFSTPQDQQHSAINISNPDPAPLQTESNSPQLPEKLEISNASLLQNLDDCRKFKRKLQDKTGHWLGENYTGKKLAKEGFDLDQVTVILDRFRNYNFARSWRISQIKANSEHGARETRLAQKMAELLNGALPEGINFKLDYPQAPFSEYPDMTAAQKKQALDEQQITVDDIAALIKQKSLSEQELIELTLQLENPDSIVGSIHSVRQLT